MTTASENDAAPSLSDVRALVDDFMDRTAGWDDRALCQAIAVQTERRANYVWRDGVRTQIQKLSRPDELGVWLHVLALRSQCLYEHYLERAPIQPVFDVLQAIHGIDRAATIRKTESPVDWKLLIESACVYSRIAPSLGEGRDWQLCFPREFGVSQAALRLRERGYAVGMTPQGLSLSEDEDGRLVARLEQLVAQIGGLNVIRQVFSMVGRHFAFDQEMERYLLFRRNDLGSKRGPDTPYGYLISLSVKHLGKAAWTPHIEEQWAELVRLATDYASLYDVQEYMGPLIGPPPGPQLPSLLAKRALYDAIFGFPQLKSSYVCRILRGVLYSRAFGQPHGFGWSLDALFAVIEHVYRLVGEQRGPVVLNIRTTTRGVPGVRPALARRILLELFCHPESGPNQRFTRPTDRTVVGVDPLKGHGNSLYFRPFLRLGSDSVLMLDRSVAGPAFVEAVLAAMRCIVGKAFQEDVVGPGLEHLARQEFSAHGIGTLSGDYDVAGTHGECDVVVQTSGRLAFLELKSKVLTRDASAGSDVAVTLSLAGSVIAAQQQAIGHELLLRKHGRLDLVADDPTLSGTLAWDGQDVDRIALGLLDYGVFQDRTVVGQLLKSMLGANYEAVEEEVRVLRRREFKKLNASLEKLTTYASDWIALMGSGRDPFFNCWFLSISQLLVLLEGTNGPDEFFRNLDSLRHITYQSCNFYFEYGMARKRNSHQLPR